MIQFYVFFQKRGPLSEGVIGIKYILCRSKIYPYRELCTQAELLVCTVIRAGATDQELWVPGDVNAALRHQLATVVCNRQAKSMTQHSHSYNKCSKPYA